MNFSMHIKTCPDFANPHSLLSYQANVFFFLKKKMKSLEAHVAPLPFKIIFFDSANEIISLGFGQCYVQLIGSTI